MKITTSDSHPFFNTYHDHKYIKSHGSEKIISLKDDKQPKRKYILENDLSKELVVYHIDGGIIPGSTSNKCDYGIYTEDDLLILIELKGCDYKHALEQVDATIDQLITANTRPQRLCARIVGKKIPRASTSNTDETKLVKRIKAFGNGTFDKRDPQMTEKLSKI